MKNRRDLKNFFTQPKEQIHLIITIVVCWTSLFTLSLVLFLRSTRDNLIQFGVTTEIQPEFLSVVENSLSTTMWTLVMFIGILGLMLFFWLFALSHRVFGPAVQIKRIIGELRAGNYAIRGKLRKGDAFHELMEDLNMLAEDLERKNR